MNPSERRFVVIAAVVSLLFFGSIPVVVRGVHADPFSIGFHRLLLANACFALYSWVTGKWPRHWKSHWRPMMGLGLVFALHWLTYFFSVKQSGVALGVLGLNSYGVHLIFLTWWLEGTRPRMWELIALGLVLTGVFLLTPTFSFSDRGFQGLLLGLASGFFFACLPMIHRRHQTIALHERAFGQFFFAFLIFACFLPKVQWHWSVLDWAGLVYLGIFCTFVAHTLWSHVTTALATRYASLLYYLTIPLAILLAYVFLNETLTPTQWVGATSIVGGNVLGLQPFQKR